MLPLLLYLITPSLGLLKNYIKYKQCNFKMYVRTPLVYIYLHFIIWLWGTNNIVLKTLIMERWVFFISKSIKSYIKNDYINKKQKYIEKYGLEYIK